MIAFFSIHRLIRYTKQFFNVIEIHTYAACCAYADGCILQLNTISYEIKYFNTENDKKEILINISICTGREAQRRRDVCVCKDIAVANLTLAERRSNGLSEPMTFQNKSHRERHTAIGNVRPMYMSERRTKTKKEPHQRMVRFSTVCSIGESNSGHHD